MVYSNNATDENIFLCVFFYSCIYEFHNGNVHENRGKKNIVITRTTDWKTSTNVGEIEGLYG